MHEQFMRLALAQAAQSGSDVPVGAVIVRDGQVIASAHNEREAQDSPLAHAEMLAMERACRALYTRRLSGCTLYVTLEPCPMCAGAMADGAAGRLRVRRRRRAAGLLRQRVRSAATIPALFHRVPWRRRGAGE